jgi:hypothetical protein
MTGGNLAAAYLFIQIAGVSILLIVCGILILKAYQWFRLRRRLQCKRQVQAYFIEIQIALGHDGPLPKPERTLNRMEKFVVQAKLMAWIDRMDGNCRDKIITLCEELGFVAQELSRLKRRGGIRKVQAAYRLGFMRSKQAAPMLLQELKKQPFGSSLFIYARSLALCARGTEDWERMVMEIVKHRKLVHEITAAILEETGGDMTELMDRLLASGNPQAKQIALQYMHKKANKRDEALDNVVLFRESLGKGNRHSRTRVI